MNQKEGGGGGGGQKIDKKAGDERLFNNIVRAKY